MNPPRLSCFRRQLGGAVFALCLWVTASARAFPPAPSYTLYGMVRDQVGQALSVEGAVVVLLKGGVEVGRTPVVSDLRTDQNYELKIRIDANRPATRLYSSAAIPASGVFSLVVEMNGQRLYPIEVSNNLIAGKGSERVRLDLNLGEDSDGDGLPDIWEQWQLFQAGHFPDEDGNWELGLIDRGGDFDGDGKSNHLEYIAGTFAGDATERFELVIKEKTPTRVGFEFFAITGKVYTLERSGDGRDWTRIPFAPSEAAEAEAAESYRASSVGILPIYCNPSDAAGRELYRLTVR